MIVNNIKVSPYAGDVRESIKCIVCNNSIWRKGDHIRRHYMLGYIKSGCVAGYCNPPDTFMVTCSSQACIDLFNLNPLAYDGTNNG